MVTSQPELLLRAVSDSMAMHWHGTAASMSVAHITTKENGDIPGRGSCAELNPPLTGCGALETWPPPLTGGSAQ